MPVTTEALAILLLLLPGFLARMISEALNLGHDKPSTLEIVISGTLFTLTAHIIYWTVKAIIIPLNGPDLAVSLADGSPNVSFGTLIALLVIAIISGFIWGKLRRDDTLHNWLKNRGLTHYFHEPTLWLRTFRKAANRNHANIRLSNGVVYTGGIKWYSPDADDQEVLLITHDFENDPIRRYDPETGRTVPLVGELLLILPGSDIEAIELDHKGEIE